MAYYSSWLAAYMLTPLCSTHSREPSCLTCTPLEYSGQPHVSTALKFMALNAVRGQNTRPNLLICSTAVLRVQILCIADHRDGMSAALYSWDDNVKAATARGTEQSGIMQPSLLQVFRCSYLPHWTDVITAPFQQDCSYDFEKAVICWYWGTTRGSSGCLASLHPAVQSQDPPSFPGS